VLHPADPGEFRVFNQFTESFSVMELAELVQKAGVQAGLEVDIQPLDNPRVEAESHYYNPAHTKLLDLGLRPHLLSSELVGSMLSVIDRFRDRVIAPHIEPRDRWRPAT
jgi:UDP-sulfoquinovose synthase